MVFYFQTKFRTPSTTTDGRKYAVENGYVGLQMQSDVGDHYEEIFNAISTSKIEKLKRKYLIPTANERKVQFFATWILQSSYNCIAGQRYELV